MPAVVDEPREGAQHRFADGDRVGRAGKSERVGPRLGIFGGEHPELELPERDDR